MKDSHYRTFFGTPRSFLKVLIVFMHQSLLLMPVTGKMKKERAQFNYIMQNNLFRYWGLFHYLRFD